MAHFRSGTLDRCIAVPVLTLKYDRQSVHQYGIFACEASPVRTEPHLGQ